MDAALEQNPLSPFELRLPPITGANLLVPVGKKIDQVLHALPGVSKLVGPNLHVVHLPNVYDQGSNLGLVITHREFNNIIREYQSVLKKAPDHVKEEFFLYVKNGLNSCTLIDPEKTFLEHGLLPKETTRWPAIVAVLRSSIQGIRIRDNGSLEYKLNRINPRDALFNQHPLLGDKKTDCKQLMRQMTSLVGTAFPRPEEFNQVMNAVDFVASKCDEAQLKRKNGDPEWVHPLYAAAILLNLGSRNLPLVLGVLLHDMPENTNAFSALKPGQNGWEHDTRVNIIFQCKEFGCSIAGARKTADLVIAYTKRKFIGEKELSDKQTQNIYLNQLCDLCELLGKAVDIIHNRSTADTMSAEKTNDHYTETIDFLRKFRKCLKDLQSLKNYFTTYVNHKDIIPAHRACNWIEALLSKVANLQRSRGYLLPS